VTPALIKAEKMKHRPYALLIFLFALPLMLSSAMLSSARADDTAEVSIKLFSFNPKVLEVPAGTTVVWTNGDAIEHSVTNGVPGKPGGVFDSGFFTEGQKWSFEFTEPGEYPYFCRRHESMTGVVKVTAP
jgi:plastocyanin